MKKVNRMIAIMLSVLLLAAAFCMTACKDDKKNPNTPTTTTKPNPGNDTRKNPNTTTDPRTLVVETNWGLAADTVVMTLNFKGSEYKLTAGELYALGAENVSALDQTNALVRGGSINVFNGVNLKAVLDSVGVDVSDAETTNIYSLVLTQAGGTEQDLSDKISALSLFDCMLAFANNGKPIGSPDNRSYHQVNTLHRSVPATNKSNHRQKGVRQLPFSLFLIQLHDCKKIPVFKCRVSCIRLSRAGIISP